MYVARLLEEILLPEAVLSEHFFEDYLAACVALEHPLNRRKSAHVGTVYTLVLQTEGLCHQAANGGFALFSQFTLFEDGCHLAFQDQLTFYFHAGALSID